MQCNKTENAGETQRDKQHLWIGKQFNVNISDPVLMKDYGHDTSTLSLCICCPSISRILYFYFFRIILFYALYRRPDWLIRHSRLKGKLPGDVNDAQSMCCPTRTSFVALSVLSCRCLTSAAFALPEERDGVRGWREERAHN